MYLCMVIILQVLVDFLLLLGAEHLLGDSPKPVRAALGAALGGIHSSISMLTGFSFLGSGAWRLLCLLLMALVCYGMEPSSLRKGAAFILLSLSLGGFAGQSGMHGLWALLLGLPVVALLWLAGFRNPAGRHRLVPMELTYGDKRIQLTALRDTGNTLRDPISGGQVTVLAADVAEQLTGLTRQQLCHPLETMGAIPGLRLIPYRSVGQERGLLLGIMPRQMKIAGKNVSGVVAFAPQILSVDGEYGALTGGMA